MESFDLIIPIGRAFKMWKGHVSGESQEINDLDLCKCHLSCNNLVIVCQSNRRRRATPISARSVSVAGGCKMGAVGKE